MHLGMAGPAGGLNPFTADDIQELMGLIPGDQQQQQQQSNGHGNHHQQHQLHPSEPTAGSHQQHQQQQMDNSMNSMQQQQQHHPPMHMQAVSNASSSGLTAVLSTNPPAPRDGSTTEIDEGSKSQARSERKRSREKQRRTDVNKQFGELTEVLKRIESEEQQLQQERAAREEARDGAKANQPSRMVLPPFSPTNRVDLIARTIAHLERLSHVTKKQVQEVQKLEEQLKNSQKAGEDMAQKLKDAVFNQGHPPNGMMTMNGMMGNGMVANQMFNPMQMAMGGMNPMANGATNGMMSIQPQKQQMMMMVPMMMPGAGANGATGAPSAPMMPAGNQPFMMMPQAFMPSQQPQQTVSAPASTNGSSANSAAAPSSNTNGRPAPAPSVPHQQLQNQQAMVMQQAMMMQSMQPMMQQMQMMQQQQQQQPQMARQAQPQMIFPAPQQASTTPQPAPIAAPVTAGMQASQQQQLQSQQPTQQRLSPSAPSSNASNNGSTSSQGSSQQQDATKGGGSYAYAA